jgi:peptidoglycan/xylan/chitin deacetylase (PgdA/CDA1 family)
MNNILSVDLESWIHIYIDIVNDRKNVISSAEKKVLDNNYIIDATMNLLDLLKKYNQKATFFIPAEIYEWYPGVIEEVEKRGHEIGYHSYSHPWKIANAGILESELEKSHEFLKRFKPQGFRAPQLFITRDSFSCLKKWGFKYSSSTYDDFIIRKLDGILEVPVSAIRYIGKNQNDKKLPKNLSIKLLMRKLPVGGGMFISLFGSRVSHFIKYLNRSNKPAILIVHPWQLYKHQKIKGFQFVRTAIINNVLGMPYVFSVLKGFEKLLQQFKFISFQEYLEKENILRSDSIKAQKDLMN